MGQSASWPQAVPERRRQAISFLARFTYARLFPVLRQQDATTARPNKVTRVRQRHRFNALELVREPGLLVRRALLLQRGQRAPRPIADRSRLVAARRSVQRFVTIPDTVRRIRRRVA